MSPGRTAPSAPGAGAGVSTPRRASLGVMRTMGVTVKRDYVGPLRETWVTLSLTRPHGASEPFALSSLSKVPLPRRGTYHRRPHSAPSPELYLNCVLLSSPDSKARNGPASLSGPGGARLRAHGCVTADPSSSLCGLHPQHQALDDDSLLFFF